MARYKLATKNGYDFYEVASLLQKALRRGDLVMASRAMNEFHPGYTNYAWNRLMTVSAEDCADMVTTEIVALYDAWLKVNERVPNKTKGRVFLAKALVVLAKARHSRDADELNGLVSDRLPEAEFRAAMKESLDEFGVDRADFKIPDYVYDIHTRRGRLMGRTVQDFWEDETEALENPTSIFDNLDKMIAGRSGPYVPPQGLLF